MSLRGCLVVVSSLAALTVATPAVAAPKAGRLVPFASCPALLGYAKTHAAPYVTANGLGRPVTALARSSAPGIVAPNAAAAGGAAVPAAPPQEGVDYSGTNDQEVGVDEPDDVKTNGNTLFTIRNGSLDAVDVSGKAPKLLDTLPLTTGDQLLLSGTHLLVLGNSGTFIQPLPARMSMPIAPIPSTSTLTEIDVSDPSALRVVKTLTLDGQYVSARMVGSTVRVVSSSSLPYAVPLTGHTVAANRAALARSPIGKWLPTYKLGKAAPHAMVQCRDVLRPPSYSGLGLLTVLTVDLAKGLDPVDSTAIMTDGSIVYASPTSLFVATEKWSVRPLPASPEIAPSQVTTQIHDFDISDPTKATYLGSGTVPGYLLDQWSLSDFQGVLRVVSTDSPAWWGGTDPTTQSYLTTLEPKGGQLVQVGQLGGLGKGHKVYSVRFDGNTGYVDTFRQIDPLYTLDVSNPAQPKELGELEIEGYSSYLHPVGQGLLLGVGQDVPTTGQTEPSGSQLTLFDVSNLAHPTALAHVSLGPGWSSAESDHHAFLYWPTTGTVVVPLDGKAIAYRVSRSGFQLVGAVAHPTGSIDRSLVDRSALVTVSDGGVQANDLATLALLGWAAFPAPTPKPVPSPLPLPVPGGPNAGTGR